MKEYYQEIIPMLSWLIVIIGGALLSLLVWIGKRLQNKVDEIPVQVSRNVEKVHDALVLQMQTMNDTHAKLEKDVREQWTNLDRRVVRLEVRFDIQDKK